MALTLARDDKQSVLQVGSYATVDYINLDGTSASDVTSLFSYTTVIRIKSYGADNWVTRLTEADYTLSGGSYVEGAVSGEGMLLANGEEITMVVYPNDAIATIGGYLNIVPVAK